MPVQEAMKYRVGIDYGNPENHITIVPPISDELLDRMIEAGLIAPSTASRTERGERATRIPYGRLILGNESMDRATQSLADDISEFLNEE